MTAFVRIALQRRAVGRLFVGLGAAAGLAVVALGSDDAREGTVALLAAVVGAAFTAWIAFALERGGLERRAEAARPAPPDGRIVPGGGLRPRRAALVGIALAAWAVVAVLLLDAAAVVVPAVAAGIGGASLLTARWAERWERARGGARLLAERPEGVRARTPDLYVAHAEGPGGP